MPLSKIGYKIDLPVFNILFDLLLYVIRDFLSFLQEILEDESANGILQNGVGNFFNG
jgi:hypothetical protein